MVLGQFHLPWLYRTTPGGGTMDVGGTSMIETAWRWKTIRERGQRYPF
jgi:hypothetical protein